jgi:hypothetical protein
MLMDEKTWDHAVCFTRRTNEIVKNSLGGLAHE